MSDQAQKSLTEQQATTNETKNLTPLVLVDDQGRLHIAAQLNVRQIMQIITALENTTVTV